MTATLSALEDHTLLGYWWLPEDPQKKLAGTLRFDPAGALELDLIGRFEERFDYGTARATYKSILGMASSRTGVTLVDCRTISASHTPGGLDATVFRCTWALVGDWLPEPDVATPERALVHFTNAEEWYGQAPFGEVLTTSEEGKFSGLSASATPTGPVPVQVQDAPFTLEFVHELTSASTARRYRSLSWEHRLLFALAGKGPRTVLELRDDAVRLQNLLTLSNATPVAIRSLRMQFTSNTSTSLLWSQRWNGGEELRDPMKLLVPYSRIGAEFGSCVDRWCELVECVEEPLNVILGTIYDDRLSLEFLFLSAAQAAESLHRLLVGGTFIDPDDYGRVSDALVAAIPREVDSDFRESLKSKIGYGNELSFRRRLRSLMECVSPRLRRRYYGDTDRFLHSVVRTRNYLTHYSSQRTSGAAAGLDLYLLARRLQLLVILFLMDRLGVKQTVLEEGLERSALFSHIDTREQA